MAATKPTGAEQVQIPGAQPAQLDPRSRIVEGGRMVVQDRYCSRYGAVVRLSPFDPTPEAIALVMNRTRPQVTVHLLEGATETLVAELVQGRIDLLVGRLPIPSAATRTEQEILYDDPIRLVCRADHPLTKKGVVAWKDTLDYGWVLPESGHGQRHINQHFQRMGLERRRRWS